MRLGERGSASASPVSAARAETGRGCRTQARGGRPNESAPPPSLLRRREPPGELRTALRVSVEGGSPYGGYLLPDFAAPPPGEKAHLAPGEESEKPFPFIVYPCLESFINISFIILWREIRRRGIRPSEKPRRVLQKSGGKSGGKVESGGARRCKTRGNSAEATKFCTRAWRTRAGRTERVGGRAQGGERGPLFWRARPGWRVRPAVRGGGERGREGRRAAGLSARGAPPGAAAPEAGCLSERAALR